MIIVVILDNTKYDSAWASNGSYAHFSQANRSIANNNICYYTPPAHINITGDERAMTQNGSVEKVLTLCSVLVVDEGKILSTTWTLDTPLFVIGA